MEKVELLDKKEETDAEVTWEDQKNINAFSKMNLRITTLEKTIEEKKSEREILEDLESELLLASADIDLDDDLEADELPNGIGGESKIPFKIGDCFVNLTSEEVETLVETKKDELDKAIETLADQIEEMTNNMSSIKTKLYAKFGTSINLER